MRIKEIEARLAAIKQEIEQRGDAMAAAEIDALEQETTQLTEERAGLIAAVEKRNGILDNIAKGAGIFKSITFDNGSEFMDCAGIEKSVYGKDRKRTKVYYCHPYSAYERGTNENINKMIRRFLPKGTDFRKVTAAYIQRVETWINNYPREILGFETSGSLFERYVAEAA